MKAKSTRRAAIMKIFAIALLAALLALTALPVSKGQSCAGAADDYNLCISLASNSDPEDVGSEPESPWYQDDCEDDDCR